MGWPSVICISNPVAEKQLISTTDIYQESILHLAFVLSIWGNIKAIKYGSFLSGVCNTRGRTSFSLSSLLYSLPISFKAAPLVKEFLFSRDRIPHEEAQVKSDLFQQFPMEPNCREHWQPLGDWKASQNLCFSFWSCVISYPYPLYVCFMLSLQPGFSPFLMLSHGPFKNNSK